jgi:hypothetical protein
MTIERSSNPDLMIGAVGTWVYHFFAFINIKDLGLVPLDVEPQQVVLGQTESADWCF